ncbi:uncharacterized protein LOC117174789 [Belonocnema kinseyi]|uniref:uncharacterized protein LOC117174789 n=1 Tax=Belonocnema kinseyi TaxID=2817044 RepID=UPI00143D2042|nr:uncharacterized protein LOC117174789 [Belonocnema kinseyi]XP_033220048.1 uncharacterized protein LOC117174789 [Belonocnema kinseyi]
MSNLKEQNSITKQSEVQNQLGVQLSKVVFDQSHSAIKKKLGLPPLVGPGKEVQISPSDQLLEKNILRHPIHRNRIQACTHDGILVIGEQALERYRELIEARIRSKCYEDLLEEKNMRKAEKRSAVELCLRKTKERYKNCVLALKCRFKEKLETQLEKSLDECKRKMQEAILRERAVITRDVLKKMRDEIGFVVTSLYRHFEDNLCAEKQNMIAEFNQIMRHDRLKTDATMREMIRKKEEELQISLEQFKLQKIVDLTYVLCSERMRCTSEKHEMRQSFDVQTKS